MCQGTATIDILGYGTACHRNIHVLLDITSFTATIDTSPDLSTIDIHCSLNGVCQVRAYNGYAFLTTSGTKDITTIFT